jgi:hypothetical protein
MVPCPHLKRSEAAGDRIGDNNVLRWCDEESGRGGTCAECRGRPGQELRIVLISDDSGATVKCRGISSPQQQWPGGQS